MADNNPTNPSLPPGAGKVSPKKETVRINLPPKPSAAPTIKLPTLPPGGPSAMGPAPASFQAPPATPAPAQAPRTGAAPVAAPSASQPRPAPRPAPAPALSTFDLILAIGAAVAGLVAIGSTVFCYTLFTGS